jgi:hypothetical protein
MELQLIGKVSKGSKMDQVYVPKNRTGFEVGEYVLIKSISEATANVSFRANVKPFFYNTLGLSIIKLRIIEEIFKIIENNVLNVKNIIVVGSFLEEGFDFNDIDVIIIKDKLDNKKIKLEEDRIKGFFQKEFGVKGHLLFLTSEMLISGLATDPIYENMLSKFVSKKRVVFNTKRKIIPEMLDVHLLKSKTLLDNFDTLNGREKYYFTKNLVAIYLFLHGKKISNLEIDKEIKKMLGIEPQAIKENLLDKKEFIRKYNEFYKVTLNLIMDKVKERENGTK